MIRRIALLAIGFCISITSAFAGDNAVIQYQARLFQNNSPVGEDVEMKFAIVDDAAGITLWSNDGSSTGGLEPAGFVAVEAANGVVSVDVGSGSLAGMDEIPKFIFNRDDDVKLRVWFNDTINGFEKLEPDLPIRVEEYRLVRLSEDLTVYVDPVNGNNANTGLSPTQAKRTIQHAIDAIPDRVINGAVLTVDLADGVYRESLSMAGFIYNDTLGSAIVFQGDETSTATMGANPSVRITGLDDDGQPTVISRKNGIQLIGSTYVYFNGIKFDYFSGTAVTMREASRIYLNGCNFSNNNYGVIVGAGASGLIYDSTVLNSGDHGIWLLHGASGTIERTNSSNNTGTGLRMSLGSTAIVTDSTFDDNSKGIWLTDLATATLVGTVSASDNSGHGYVLERQSLIRVFGSMGGSGNALGLSTAVDGSGIY